MYSSIESIFLTAILVYGEEEINDPDGSGRFQIGQGARGMGYSVMCPRSRKCPKEKMKEKMKDERLTI